jgi:hypothetical protein
VAATHFFGSQFFGGEFFFTRVEIIDTHDGERKRRHWEAQRRAKEELREQILAAFKGPLAPALEALASPGAQPIDERIDTEALLADLELWQSVREAAERHRAMLDEDDEEVVLLLI